MSSFHLCFLLSLGFGHGHRFGLLEPERFEPFLLGRFTRRFLRQRYSTKSISIGRGVSLYMRKRERGGDPRLLLFLGLFLAARACGAGTVGLDPAQRRHAHARTRVEADMKLARAGPGVRHGHGRMVFVVPARLAVDGGGGGLGLDREMAGAGLLSLGVSVTATLVVERGRAVHDGHKGHPAVHLVRRQRLDDLRLVRRVGRRWPPAGVCTVIGVQIGLMLMEGVVASRRGVPAQALALGLGLGSSSRVFGKRLERFALTALPAVAGRRASSRVERAIETATGEDGRFSNRRSRNRFGRSDDRR